MYFIERGDERDDYRGVGTAPTPHPISPLLYYIINIIITYKATSTHYSQITSKIQFKTTFKSYKPLNANPLYKTVTNSLKYNKLGFIKVRYRIKH